MAAIADNMVVAFDYTLTLDDGEVIDTSEGREPLEVIQGQGQIIAGLEKALYGLEIGDNKQVTVAPAEGYGEFDSDLFETLPRTAFPADLDIQPGMGFRMRNETGAVVVAYVASVSDESVEVNLNHPLAGKTLHFDVTIASLREATPEEINGCNGACASCSANCG